jgi:hypothetical protein
MGSYLSHFILPAADENIPPLVVLDGRPIVKAKVAAQRDAVFLAKGKADCDAVVREHAVGEGVLAQQGLKRELVKWYTATVDTAEIIKYPILHLILSAPP